MYETNKSNACSTDTAIVIDALKGLKDYVLYYIWY